MLSTEDNEKALKLTNDLKWIAAHEVTGYSAIALAEAADLLSKFVSERQTLQVYIEEREWNMREG
jgi:hypothetical protein